MKKRFLSIIFSIVFACPFISACEQNESISSEQHTHTWGAWTIENAATCTQQGKEKRICNNCEEIEYREITATGHEWKKWYVSKNPTCTEQGTETRECDNCGHTQSVPVLALNHKYNEPTFLWNNIPDDSNSVTATAVCQNDKSHTHNVSCEIEKTFSYNQDETIIFLVETAKMDLDGVSYTSTRYKRIFQWRTMSITSNNCYDWLHLGFLYTAPNTVAFEVIPLYDDVVYSDISVTFTTDTLGRIYYTSGSYSTAFVEHQYDDFTLSLGEYKEETLKTALSVQSCTIEMIHVQGTVSYWQEVSSDWVYE